MEVFIILLALFVSTAIGAGIGFFIATQWQFHLTVSRKDNYEAKVAELEKLISDLETQILVAGEENPYSAHEMFPPNIDLEYGLPKSLKR
jgi:hypothetical protein